MSQKWYCQTLKAFRIASSEMKIPLLIHYIYIYIYIYISIVLKNNTIGTVDMGGRGDLMWKCANMFWWKNIFWLLWPDKPLWVELKTNRGGNIYYYITILSLFRSFRDSQHPGKWSVSFKNVFRKCECVNCYLPISSNLQFQF